jgi:hypothetical protein
MTDDDARNLCESRKRCKILASKGSYFKPGQHGYVVAHSRAGGFHWLVTTPQGTCHDEDENYR